MHRGCNVSGQQNVFFDLYCSYWLQMFSEADHHLSMEAVNCSKALSDSIRVFHAPHFLILMGYAGLYNPLYRLFVSNAFCIYCCDSSIHMNRTVQAACRKPGSAEPTCYFTLLGKQEISPLHMQCMKCNRHIADTEPSQALTCTGDLSALIPNKSFKELFNCTEVSVATPVMWESS